MSVPILVPAAVLVIWSLIVLCWMVVTRFAALSKVGINLKTAPPGGRGQDLDGTIPARVMWKSHNYDHLLEQPTLFYAVIVILALSKAGDRTNLVLAWTYVVIRIVHSLWQGIVNTIPVRFTLFLLSSFCLGVLAINALRAVI